ncbi:hypothetical protein MYX75_01140 [Acidobacteria bacterium AH-259-A15]|nr:hypothetical protein [Acidobacteria bacterium AH-259-A15]
MDEQILNVTEYDPQSHTYRLEGIKIPSVTEIMQSAGLIDTTWFDEESRWRGSVVHRACQLEDENDLDESTVPDEVKGYLEAWRKFKAETGIQAFTLIEEPLFSRNYAGMPDRLWEWRQPRRFVPRYVDHMIIDIKTGSVQRWVGVQLSAYGNLVSPNNPIKRLAVRISKDGKYNVKEFPIFERRTDFQIFLSALAIHNWKRGNQ